MGTNGLKLNMISWLFDSASDLPAWQVVHFFLESFKIYFGTFNHILFHSEVTTRLSWQFNIVVPSEVRWEYLYKELRKKKQGSPFWEVQYPVFNLHLRRIYSALYLQIVRDSADGSKESAVTSLVGSNFRVCFHCLSLSVLMGQPEVCFEVAPEGVNTPSEGMWLGGTDILTTPQRLREGACSKISSDDRRDTMDEKRGAQILRQQL